MTTPPSQAKIEQPKKRAPEIKADVAVRDGMSPAVSSVDLQAAMENHPAAKPEAVLKLQRISGNRAVSKVLQPKSGLGSSNPDAGSPLPVEDEPEKLQTKPVAAAPASTTASNPLATPSRHLWLDTPKNDSPSSAPVIQTKLTVSEPCDQQEIEADQVAEQVLKMPGRATPPPPAPNAPSTPNDGENNNPNNNRPMVLNRYLQRKPTLQRSADGIGGGPVSSDVQSRIEGMQQGGRPLPDSEREFFEPRMGVDLSNVRIHTDSTAVETSKELNARAYTVGPHVAFNSGEFQPGTTEGRKLMGHELTHVVQQGAAGELTQRKSIQRKDSAPSFEEAMQEAITQVTSEDVEKQEVGPIEAEPMELPEKKVETEKASIGGSDYKPESGKKDEKDATTTQSPTAPAPESTKNTTDAAVAAPAAAQTTKESAAPETAPVAEQIPPTASATPGTVPTTSGEVAAPVAAEAPTAESAKAETAPTADQAPAAESAKPDAAPTVATAAPDAADQAPAASTTPEAAPTAVPPTPTAQETAPATPTVPVAEPASASSPAESGASTPGPDANPAFQGVVSGIAAVAENEQTHETGEQTASESAAAAEMPEAEKMGKAQNVQVGSIENAAEAQEDKAMGGNAPGFDKAAFVSAVEAKIIELTPKDPKKMENIKESGIFGQIQSAIVEIVDAGKEGARGDVDDKANEEPNEDAIPDKDVTALEKNDPGSLPSPVNTQGAVPLAQQPSKVEQPIEDESRSIDEKMAEANVTDEQLENSKEPSFEAAVKSKHEAQAEVKDDLQSYRTGEKATLTTTSKDAQQMESQSRTDMHQDREQSFGVIDKLQTNTKTEDEGKRAEIGKAIDAIYNDTEKAVNEILTSLDTKVDETFEKGASDAKSAATEYIERETKKFKDARYEGVGGFVQAGVDWVTGMPPEYNEIYNQGRELYITQMKVTLNLVADVVADHLTRAKDRVTQGRGEITKYVESQPKALRGVAEKAAEEASSKFDSLEETIDSKQGELIDKLAQNYTDALKSLDDDLSEMKKKSSGLLGMVKDAINDTVGQIVELGKNLARALGRVAHVVTEILKDPGKFVGHLIDAIKQGFGNFVKNIGTHLQTGLINWLTGTLDGVGITLPEKFDLPGIFSLVAQILGVSLDKILGKVAKAIGPRGPEVIEGLKAAWDVFQIIKSEGLGGLWKFVQNMIGDLKTMVMDQIKAMITDTIVKAGADLLLSLLAGPAGPFIKAVQAIISVVTWFMDNAGRITALINSILDSVEAISKGDIGGAAKFIEDSLAKALPTVIDFLAKLLHVDDIVKKVKKVITDLRALVDKALDPIIKKAVAIGKSLLSKLGLGKKKKAPGEDDDKDAKVKAGLSAIDAYERKEADSDGLSPEGADKVAANVKQKYPVFSSMVAVPKGDHWAYDYEIQRMGKKIGTEKIKNKEDVDVSKLMDAYKRPSFSSKTKEDLDEKLGKPIDTSKYDRGHIEASYKMWHDFASRFKGKTYKDALANNDGFFEADEILGRRKNYSGLLQALRKKHKKKFNTLDNLEKEKIRPNRRSGKLMQLAYMKMKNASTRKEFIDGVKQYAKYSFSKKERFDESEKSNIVRIASVVKSEMNSNKIKISDEQVLKEISDID